MPNAEVQIKPIVEGEGKHTPEKAAAPSKETISAKRVEDAADKLADRMIKSHETLRTRFSQEKSKTFLEKMMGKVDEVKACITFLSEKMKGGATGVTNKEKATDKSSSDRMTRFEALSPTEKEKAALEGIRFVTEIQVVRKNFEAPRGQEIKAQQERELNEAIPGSMRIAISDVITVKNEWNKVNTQVDFSKEYNLQQYKGHYNGEGGVIAFVDRQGKSWVTGDTPLHRTALKDAGYFPEPNMKVPLSRGEELSGHENPSGSTQYSTKLDMIKAFAQRDRAAAEKAEAEKKKSEFFKGTSLG